MSGTLGRFTRLPQSVSWQTRHTVASVPACWLSVSKSLQRHGQCAEVALTDLSEEAVGAYLAQRFPSTGLPEGFARVLHHRTNAILSSWSPWSTPWYSGECCVLGRVAGSAWERKRRWQRTLDKAREKASAAHVEIEWVRQDMRDLVRPDTLLRIVPLQRAIGYATRRVQGIKRLESQSECRYH
jgi:hypothetical protein